MQDVNFVRAAPRGNIMFCVAVSHSHTHTTRKGVGKKSHFYVMHLYILCYIILYKATTFVAHKRAELQKDKKSSLPPPPHNNILYIYKHIILCIGARKSHLSLYRRHRRRSSLVLSEWCVCVYIYIYIHE